MASHPDLHSKSFTVSDSTPSPVEHSIPMDDIDDNSLSIYDNIPNSRKWAIVFVASWATLSATFSSTSLLSADKEIAADFGSTTAVVNLATGGLLFIFGCSPLVWGPIEMILGRRIAYNACIATLLVYTCGQAVAPNLAAFLALRTLSGLQGSYFHVTGQTVIAELFPPVRRGTATGLFLCGAVFGPALGPLVAGVMVTYRSWRLVLWLQVAMIGLGLILSVLFVPSSPLDPKRVTVGLPSWKRLKLFNPLPVFATFRYPNVLLTSLSCGLLSWSQYSLLAAPRHVISTRFGLTSPLTSGLFYLAPGIGFLVGAVLGGRFSDRTVRKWIARRGVRVAHDRLWSGMFSFFFLTPAALLTYGWGLECHSCSTATAGLALPIVTSFFTAASLWISFASLNTYCTETLPEKRREVIVGKYFIHYTFIAAAGAGTVPLQEAVGIGPAATIGTVFTILAGAFTLTTAKYGSAMQRWRENRA